MMVKTAAEWEYVRGRGKTYFYVMRGIIGRGIPMAVAIMLIIEVVQGHPLGAALQTRGFWLRFALAIALFSLGGVLNAMTHWRLAERRFGGGASS